MAAQRHMTLDDASRPNQQVSQQQIRNTSIYETTNQAFYGSPYGNNSAKVVNPNEKFGLQSSASAHANGAKLDKRSEIIEKRKIEKLEHELVGIHGK